MTFDLQVLFSHAEPPKELEGTDALVGDNVGYITFVLFPRCFKDAANQERTINLIHTFRDYLHYHIKCSKVTVAMVMSPPSCCCCYVC